MRASESFVAPLYAEIAELLRSRIAAGVWRPGARLPSEAELCRDLGVSSITLRRAMASLVDEGRLIRVQGKGSFVSSDHAFITHPPRLTSFTEDMRERGWDPSAQVLAVRTAPAGDDVGLRLGLAAEEPVTIIKRLRYADRAPIAIQTAHIPAALFPGLEEHDFSRESIYSVLRARYASAPTSARDTYVATIIRGRDAKLLEVKSGSPGLAVERLTLDARGRRIEFVTSVCRGDRYSISLQLRARGA